MKLKITKVNLNSNLVKTQDQSWRSLEHFLKKDSREYEFNDYDGMVLVEVSSEIDAYQLGRAAKLSGAELIDEAGMAKRLSFSKVKKVGRPKNMVFDNSIGKGMTVNQYKKHLKETSLSKSEVVKRGLLTKSRLEKAIGSGELGIVQVGNGQRILKDVLQKYLINTNKQIQKIPLEKIEIGKTDMDTYSRSESYIHIFKCTNRDCRLEFTVLSWKDNWPDTKKPYCPECGGQDAVCLRTRFVKRMIWEIVGDPNLGLE